MTHNKAHNAHVVCLPHPDGHTGHPPMAPISGLSLIVGKPIVRLSMVMYGYVWLCMVINGYVWLFMVIYGYQWLCMVMYGYVWLCMVINGYIWLCMVMYGY